MRVENDESDCESLRVSTMTRRVLRLCQTAVDAYIKALAYTVPATVRQISKDASSKSVTQVFATHVDLCATISRLAQTVLYEPSTLQGRVSDALAPLSRLSKDVRGALLEKALGSLAEGTYRPDVAQTMLEIGDELLELYDTTAKPVRRAR